MLCDANLDLTDLFCRKCGQKCGPKKPVYVSIPTCDCCGDDADKSVVCGTCGSPVIDMTEAEFKGYLISVDKEYDEINAKEFALHMKKAALKRLVYNLKYPDDEKCTCTGTTRCGLH